MFEPPQPLVRLLCGMAIGLATGIFISLLLSSEVACKGDEHFGTCLREWVSALSGWAAAGGAILALGPLGKQLLEMRRQTSFMVGDEIPALEVIPSERTFNNGQIRIINWNRRTFLVTEIRFFADAAPVDVHSVFVNDYGDVSLIDHALDARVVVPGWEDRSNVVPSMALKFWSIKDFDVRIRDQNFHRASVEVIGYLGSEHLKIRLYEESPLDEAFLRKRL